MNRCRRHDSVVGCISVRCARRTSPRSHDPRYEWGMLVPYGERLMQMLSVPLKR